MLSAAAHAQGLQPPSWLASLHLYAATGRAHTWHSTPQPTSLICHATAHLPAQRASRLSSGLLATTSPGWCCCCCSAPTQTQTCRWVGGGLVPP